jgi:hypothetical protein
MRHHPEVTESAEVTIRCDQSATAVAMVEPVPCATIGDLEAFCRAAREQGAKDDTVVTNGFDLAVTIRRKVAPLP